MSDSGVPAAACDTMPALDGGEFEHLLGGPGRSGQAGTAQRKDHAAIGTLLGLADDGVTPLVVYGGQPGTAALRARSTVDLYGDHVGHEVVLLFEEGDPQRPIVVGCLRQPSTASLTASPGQVTVDADGARLLVSAKEQIVLRCGKASLTLTRAGKVIIEGAYISNRSSGVLRLKGGSVQIN